MNSSTRSALFVIAVIVVGLLEPGAARADCIGPTFSHTGGEFAHGEIVTVTGYGFGDNCYDTGPPPPGEGSLGQPLTGIEVYFDQGGEHHRVAVGNADEDYAWQVQIPVPSNLDIGEAHLVVLSNGFEAFRENPVEIWVTSETNGGAFVDPLTFGPSAPREPDPVSESGFAGTNWTPLVSLVGATITIVGALFLFHRRSTA